MALKFRLKGLAETFVDAITCPCCGVMGVDDQHFTTELTKVTYQGIIVVVQCRDCKEIFVPNSQKLGGLAVVTIRPNTAYFVTSATVRLNFLSAPVNPSLSIVRRIRVVTRTRTVLPSSGTKRRFD